MGRDVSRDVIKPLDEGDILEGEEEGEGGKVMPIMIGPESKERTNFVLLFLLYTQ